MKRLSEARLTLITAIGGCLEFFDFTIFALFSSYISKAFFPFNNNLTGLINTFAVFAVGYFARPIGGLIISHIGDRHGRKKSLLISVNVMALSTLGIAILPSYHHLGLLAPILLIALRLLQGAAMGGEMPGVITYLTEYFHSKKPILAIAIVFGGVTAGNMVASGLGYILSITLSPEAMAQFGWRIPFLIGALLGLIGFIIRSKTQETQIFIQLVASHAIHKLPLAVVLKRYGTRVLLAAGITAVVAITVFLFFYLPAFLHLILNRSIQNAYLITTLGFLIIGIGTVFWGYIAEKVKPFNMVITGSCLILLLSLSANFWALQIPNGIMIFYLLLAFFISIVNSCYSYLISQLFPADVRYSGVATAYNIGVAFFGAIAPTSLVSIYKHFHAINAPFWFLAIATLISIGCMFKARKIISLSS